MTTWEGKSLKGCALLYASKGVAVFPLQERSKKPFPGSNGFKNATTDQKVIADWWDKNPRANIGIATGSISQGVVVVDLDTKGGVDGIKTLTEWEAVNGELSDTLTAETGTGGRHLYYKLPEGMEQGNRVNVLPGVDIRGTGGYVVAPPSIHESGKLYRWLSSSGTIATADKAVLKLFRKKGGATGDVGDPFAQMAEPFHLPEIVEEGTRNDTLYRLACSLQGKGLTDKAISEAVRTENLARFNPPVSDAEVERTLRSALTKDKGSYTATAKNGRLEEIDKILLHFKGVQKRGGGQWQAKCPAHHDKEPSLSIKDVGDKILLHCHAGCEVSDILELAGLTWEDIGAKGRITAEEAFKPPWKVDIEAEYRYKDEHGRYLYSKLRYPGKVIKYGVAKGTELTSGKGDKEATLYRLPELIQAVKKGYPVYYVEGEKDVETLKELGLTATTAGSTSDWRREYSKYFTGARVTILADNDEAGQTLAIKVGRDLKDFAHSIKTVTPSDKEKGDVTDYIEEGNGLEDLKSLLKEETSILAPWIYLTGKGDSQKLNINVDILANVILKHDHMIIARKPGSESDVIYRYCSGVYKPLSRTELANEARQRVPIGLITPTTSKHTAEAIVQQSKGVSFDRINADEQYINLKNGLYDTKTGRMKPHSPELISTVQLNASYQEDYQEPERWHQFICDLCTDEEGDIDEQMYDMVQEWVGLIFSNVYGYRVKCALILYSPIGNTGKSVLINILNAILGRENVVNVTFQDMDGSRWATGRMHGKRLVAVGDQGTGDLESSSIFKQLTGGDMVSAEYKGKQGFDYTFRGVIVVACNILPVFKDDKGNHMIDRLGTAYCRNVIDKEKQDKFLTEKLKGEKDMILRWGLEGLHRLRENEYNFTQCDSAKECKDEYRQHIDTLYNFISEHCEITGDSKDWIKCSEFHGEYGAFCLVNDFMAIKKRNVPNRMRSQGVEVRILDGRRVYRKIKFKEFRPVLDKIGYFSTVGDFEEEEEKPH